MCVSCDQKLLTLTFNLEMQPPILHTKRKLLVISNRKNISIWYEVILAHSSSDYSNLDYSNLIDKNAEKWRKLIIHMHTVQST